MSDNINRTTCALQPAAFDENPFDWDWTALKKEVDEPIGLFQVESLQQEPPIPGWWDVPDASHEGPHDATPHISPLPAKGELHIRPQLQFTQSTQSTSKPPLHDPTSKDLHEVSHPVMSVPESFVKRPRYDMRSCDFKECGAGPYKRWADLERHQRKHSTEFRFECSAQGCKYTGSRAFSRKDKLHEHILAGHDDDTVFNCPLDPDCIAHITRDCLALHSGAFQGLQKFRKCPIPKCPFKLNAARQSMDLLQQHLLKKHDEQGRAKYAASLLQRGYDHATLKVVCPACRYVSAFQNHSEFYSHFLTTHLPSVTMCERWIVIGAVPSLEQAENICGGSQCRIHLTRAFSGPSDLDISYGNEEVRNFLRKAMAPRGESELDLEGCRTLLSLWPDFEVHDICESLRKCVSKQSFRIENDAKIAGDLRALSYKYAQKRKDAESLV